MKLFSKNFYQKYSVFVREINDNLPSFVSKNCTINDLLNASKFTNKSNHSFVQHNQKCKEMKYWYSINRLYSDFKYKYASEVEKVINTQIKAEQQAAQDYLSLAVVFLHPCQSRLGTGGYFMRMYNEEIEHMQQLVQYQLTRGAIPLIMGVTAPKVQTNITMLEAFKTALAMEKLVTELLETAIKTAEAAKDQHCVDFIVSQFLSEQMASINEMSHHVSRLSRLCDEHSLFNYDLWLSKQYPWSHKQ